MYRGAREWLNDNYDDNNGLPEFFRQGSYTFEMKATAEEDYVNTVDDMAKDYNDETRQGWAKNVQDNNYQVSLLKTCDKTCDKFDIYNCENQCLSVAKTLEYWRVLAEKEQTQQLKDRASGIGLVRPPSNPPQKRHVKKQKQTVMALCN